MSAKENASQPAEKVMTKYEIKKQKREEQKKKEEKSLMIWKIVGIVLVIGLIGFILSYPIRRIVAVNKTVVTIDGEKVGQVRFDYMYNTVKTNYMQNYGSYLSYYGLSSDTDPSTVMYNEDLSFKEYFEELAVNQLKEDIALKRAADAEGFTTDASDEWNDFLEIAEAQAKANSTNVSDFLKNTFGQYATKSNLKKIVEDSVLTEEYYQHVYESKLPTDAEIDSYYAENSATYDSVDYYLDTVDAVLPTEPTELADEGAEVGEDGSYTPSQAEKDAAMDAVRPDAEAAQATVMESGEAHIGELKSSVNYRISDWLFEEGRQEGDTTVIENTVSNLFYVVGFKARYRKEDNTADIRAIVTAEDNGKEIMAEWNATDKSEASFIELVEKYSQSSAEEGLYENQSPESYDGEVKDWLFAADRKTGDVESFFVEDAYTYVIYYKNVSDPVWKVSARDAMMSTRMNEYIDSITEGLKESGDLKYIKVEEEKAQEATDSSSDQTEDTGAEAE